MKIDTDVLRRLIQEHFDAETQYSDKMSDTHAIRFLTRLENEQIKDEEIIDSIEFLTKKYSC